MVRGEVLSHGKSLPGLVEVEDWGCSCVKEWISPFSNRKVVQIKVPSSGVFLVRVMIEKSHSPPWWIARVLDDELSSMR
jgi:hypothetical protein